MFEKENKVFGIFDPPQTRAQKLAVKSAQGLRERAVRDAMIELNMLIRWQGQARQVQSHLGLEQVDISNNMESAIFQAQETIDRAGRFGALFPRELAALKAVATSARTFEAVASYELEGRDFMVRLRDDARDQLTPLGCLIMDAKQTFQAPNAQT